MQPQYVDTFFHDSRIKDTVQYTFSHSSRAVGGYQTQSYTTDMDGTTVGWILACSSLVTPSLLRASVL